MNNMNNVEEQTISWDMMLHPDMKAIAQRDTFLSDENGKKLQEMIDQMHLRKEIEDNGNLANFGYSFLP